MSAKSPCVLHPNEIRCACVTAPTPSADINGLLDAALVAHADWWVRARYDQAGIREKLADEAQRTQNAVVDAWAALTAEVAQSKLLVDSAREDARQLVEYNGRILAERDALIAGVAAAKDLFEAANAREGQAIIRAHRAEAERDALLAENSILRDDVYRHHALKQANALRPALEEAIERLEKGRTADDAESDIVRKRYVLDVAVYEAILLLGAALSGAAP